MGNHEENRRQDTVAAIATAPGYGGVGVVRISGPETAHIARQVLGSLPSPRMAAYKPFIGSTGDEIDRGIALFFPGPGSYTGEDCLELQAHGGPLVLSALLSAACDAGAREAEPGEFTRRAFLNGRLDLAQAEAVADLIAARTDQAARAAARTLAGKFSSRILDVDARLGDLRAFVEAAIDFPDEEIDFLAGSDVLDRMKAILAQMREVHAQAKRGSLLTEGAVVVLAGLPNVGKSSLLNALAEDDVAIVTEIPGTTRDLIRQTVQLAGYPLHVVDTAGLRATEDVVEKEGVSRARKAVEHADLIIEVVDDGRPENRDPYLASHTDIPRVVVYNKVDLSGRKAGLIPNASGDAVAVSARSGAGLDALTQVICEKIGAGSSQESDFAARRRHLGAIEDALSNLEAAIRAAGSSLGGELIAEDLRHAQYALAAIVGEKDNEQLLDLIFSRFCIGK